MRLSKGYDSKEPQNETRLAETVFVLYLLATMLLLNDISWHAYTFARRSFLLVINVPESSHVAGDDREGSCDQLTTALSQAAEKHANNPVNSLCKYVPPLSP